MKITIRSNGTINSVNIEKYPDGTARAIEFDFAPPDLWSDLEIWLNDSENDKFLDYAKMNLSKRNKMQFTKG
jgi:hypothetical protein